MKIIRGGRLKEIPKPYKYRYPSNDELREVRVTVNSFTEIGSIGAKHWYVTIKEDDNYIWNIQENCWQQPWDLLEIHKGRKFEDKTTFINKPDAMSWARRIVNEHFSGVQYKVVWK